jgi:hypothetical protein
MPLQRAEIEVIDLDAEGYRRSGRTETRFPVQFNPQTLRFSKGAQIAEIAVYGLDAPLLQYVRGQAETLSVELFFDATDLGMGEGVPGVGEIDSRFYQLVKQQSHLHATPRVVFRWGLGFAFRGIVERVERSFELFAPDGTPLRATFSLSLKEYRSLEEQIAALKLSSPDFTQRVVALQGDTLQGLAARHLGDPGQWTAIAAANGIEDPLEPPAGLPLELPPIPPGARRGRGR